MKVTGKNSLSNIRRSAGALGGTNSRKISPFKTIFDAAIGQKLAEEPEFRSQYVGVKKQLQIEIYQHIEDLPTRKRWIQFEDCNRNNKSCYEKNVDDFVFDECRYTQNAEQNFAIVTWLKKIEKRKNKMDFIGVKELEKQFDNSRRGFRLIEEKQR